MSESGKAVFLSYASQDADAARKICEALRGAGVEVWFDQSELRGGDAWDAKIRRQIATCALFVPIISANTEARLEGYFRLEWKLAAQRTHTMAEEKAFLLPVVIDATRDDAAKVPTEFKAIQWTRLPAGESSQKFCERVQGLLNVGSSSIGDETPVPKTTVIRPARRRAWKLPAAAAAILVGMAALYWFFRPLSGRVANAIPAEQTKPAGEPGKRLDPKWVAVLPFENLSTDPESAIFADGIHAEMLTALSKVAALSVVGRTSVLPYRDPKARNLRVIAAELGVGSVVEGAVRRDGQQVRITVQLVDASSTRQLWSEAYTEDFNHIFAIQTAVAKQVAAQLRATLTPREEISLSAQPSPVTRAYEAYVEAKLQRLELGMGTPMSRRGYREVIAKLEEATQLDPQFAGAFVQLALTHAVLFARDPIEGTPARKNLAQRALDEAKRLAPESADTHIAAGYFSYAVLADYPEALRSLELARAMSPNDGVVRYTLGLVLRRLGRPHDAVAELERAYLLDPREREHYYLYLDALMALRRYAAVVPVVDRWSRVTGKAFTDIDGTPRAIESRYEITGDRPRLIREWQEHQAPAGTRSPRARKRAGIAAAIAAGEWADALSLLKEESSWQLESGAKGLNYLVECARLAHVLGQTDEVARLAETARRPDLNEADLRFGTLATVRAEVFFAAVQGKSVQARAAIDTLRSLKLGDAQEELTNTFRIAEAYLLLGDHQAALAALRPLLVGPTLREVRPRALRLDPIWSRLAGDARFEEILKAAKPL